MLKLTTEKPLLYNDSNQGYARYRIDFEDVNPKEKYVLGWVSPRYPKCEVREHLDRIENWQDGWVREIYQENVGITQPFTVRLYLKGLKPDEVTLLEESNYLGMQSA